MCTHYNTNSVIDYGSFSTFNVTNAAWRQNLGKFLVYWYLNNKNLIIFILRSLFKPLGFLKKKKKNTLLMSDVFMYQNWYQSSLYIFIIHVYHLYVTLRQLEIHRICSNKTESSQMQTLQMHRSDIY